MLSLLLLLLLLLLVQISLFNDAANTKYAWLPRVFIESTTIYWSFICWSKKVFTYFITMVANNKCMSMWVISSCNLAKTVIAYKLPAWRMCDFLRRTFSNWKIRYFTLTIIFLLGTNSIYNVPNVICCWRSSNYFFGFFFLFAFYFCFFFP